MAQPVANVQPYASGARLAIEGSGHGAMGVVWPPNIGGSAEFTRAMASLMRWLRRRGRARAGAKTGLLAENISFFTEGPANRYYVWC